MTSARARALSAALCLSGALLGAASAGQTWASAPVLAPTGVAGVGRSAATSGAALAPALTPLLLVAAAGLLAGLFAGPRARRAVLAVAVLGAAGALVALGIGWGGVDDALRAATVPAGQPIGQVSAAPGVVGAAAGALLALAGAALAVATAGRWPAGSGRYDAPGDPGAVGRARADGADDGPAARGAPAPGRAGENAWDALDRGEDPTI